MSFKKILKLFYFATFISIYIFSAFIIWTLFFFSFDRARNQLAKNTSRFCRFGLKLFGVKLWKNFESLPDNQNYLIVSNHLTYLDVFVISSIMPACFITSYEMKETPFLGQVCSLGGCLFVERRSKKGLSNEVKNLTKALNKNLNVVIFPEATSGNGESLLNFRRPLFQAAIDANKDILPICINYRKLDREKISLNSRDQIFWYGKMTFFPHFLKLIDADEIDIEINILEKIKTNPELGKIQLAEQSFNLIKNVYQPITE